MFSSTLRNSIRRSCRPQRTVISASCARRAYLSTGTRVPKGSGRNVWIPVAVGTLTFSAALLLNNTVRLDSEEGTKPNSKPKAKKSKQQASDTESSSKQPEELLRAKEEEAKAENSNVRAGSEGEASEAEGTEEAGSNGGAFNPETGEINWDCPCLGGMAYGPCGPEFREAFSCFVFSEEEPKGINCVEKFKAMQDCFRKHPEVYGEEIMSDDDDEDNDGDSPSGTDSPTLKGEPLPDSDPVAVPPPGIVSPSQ
ncbi:MIA40 [Sanghuangporus sanghuang]